MATSLVQIRVNDELKNEAAAVYEGLGIDLPTAVRMFLKRSVLENGIPFSMTLPKADYKADRALRAMQEASAAARDSGSADLSLDDINAEISAARRDRKAKSRPAV